MKGLRFLYHHRTLGDGAEGIHIQAIVDCLRKEGHEVRVVSLVGDHTRFRQAQGRTENRWDRVRHWIPRPAYELAEIAYNLPGYLSLSRAIAAFSPDIIYDRYAHYSCAAILAARRWGLPLLLEVNSPYAVQKSAYERVYLPRISREAERRIFRAASHVIVVSSVLRDIVAACGVPERRVTILPNGTDPERFSPAIEGGHVTRMCGLDGRVVLGFVGILRKWHRIEWLIDALHDLRLDEVNARMVFIGDGPEVDAYTRYVRQKGLDHLVLFLGRVPHDQMPQYLAMLDVAITPSATPYSSPMKLLEYMAMGKAVVAPSMPNVRELIDDGRTGILFEPENAESLRQKLRHVIVDSELRQRLGRAARERILSGLTWQENAGRIARIAVELIKR